MSRISCALLRADRGECLVLFLPWILDTHRHYPSQVLAILVGVIAASELIQLQVSHMPTDACLLLPDRRQQIGVGAPDDLTDVLEVLMSLLPGVSERIARCHSVIAHGLCPLCEPLLLPYYYTVFIYS